MFASGLSFHGVSRDTVRAGKHEVNCRFPWIMMSHNERRLVFHAFSSSRECSDSTLIVLQQAKRFVYASLWMCMGTRAV